MIPKVLHLCWLSSGPLPPKVQRYIETWRAAMPDYEIRLWNFDRFPRGKSAWVDEAFDAGKFAFAADYIRNYALYTEGGVYMDSDVQVVKSLDPLMSLPYFFGYENGSGNIDAGVMASEPGNPIFKTMLDYYEGRHFVKEDGTLDMVPLPVIMMEQLGKDFRFESIKNEKEFNRDKSVISVFPFDYFSPIHMILLHMDSSANTYTIHQFAGEWHTGWSKYRKYVKKLVGPRIYQQLINLKRLLLGKKD